MGFSEIPPPVEVEPGNDLPEIVARPPGPQSRTWLTRYAHRTTPMGRRHVAEKRGGIRADVPPDTIVYASGKGANVLDVDGNRYVDLAAGFGSLLLGHGHESVLRALELQAPRLLQGLGDVYPSDAKIGLLDRLARLYPHPDARVLLGQSGSDAITGALKTATLHTGRGGVVAFEGAYHGLGYGPLASCGLRRGYRSPFAGELNPDVTFAPYPTNEGNLDESLETARRALAKGSVGAILVEPILGRGGVIVPPDAFLPALGGLAREHSALLVADEVWTGLGRAGRWLYSLEGGAEPDLICLGKGLGGGLPMSAVLGRPEVMASWSQEAEVVHTSTFAGAPLTCATALATLDVLGRHGLVEGTAARGARFMANLRDATKDTGILEVRGAGMMVGLDASALIGGASRLQQKLLERGYVTTTGGGARDVLVLTPPLTIANRLLDRFTEALTAVLRETPAR